MRLILKSSKALTAVLLTLAMLVSAVAFAAGAREADAADEGASTYYLWGLNTNDPDFGSMTSPTGVFSHDSSGYHFDLKGTSGDYCFVVSEVSVSGAAAQRSPAVSSVAESGQYYLTQGSYRGYNCMHIWNPNGDDVRISFSSSGDSLRAVPLSSVTAPTAAQPTSPKPTSQKPTESKPTESKPTESKPTEHSDEPSGGSKTVYCMNAAGWEKVNVYLWNSTSPVQEDVKWPGAQMKNVGGDIWSYTLPKDYANIIFSTGGNRQTPDMTLPGDGYIYNNATKKWSVYDTSPLRVDSFTTDLSSPQYSGVGIVLSASAVGEGEVSYRFTVANSSGKVTVLSDYSARSWALWTPQTAGEYTLSCELRDTKGNTNSRAIGYTVKEAITSVAPYIKQVTPLSGSQIQRSDPCAVTAYASGGFTGTKLLFYKYTLRDSSGKIVNVPYYTRGSTYSFTPDAVGRYTMTVSVQGSDNTTVTRDYVYECVDQIEPSEDTGTPARPLIGDADSDGEVTILDATRIQRFLVELVTENDIDKANADADRDGEVTILDATRIQRFLADLVDSL